MRGLGLRKFFYIVLSVLFSLFLWGGTALAGFSDVPDDHWAAGNIEKMSELGVAGAGMPMEPSALIMLSGKLKPYAWPCGLWGCRIRHPATFPGFLFPCLDGRKQMLSLH